MITQHFHTILSCHFITQWVIGLLGAKPCSTLMRSPLQLHKLSGEPISDHTAYMLLYLTHSRLEIAHVVTKLSHLLDKSTTEHVLAGVHVLKYLKNNPGQGLFFSSNSSLILKGFSDFDWVACPDTRRSNYKILLLPW
jgi:hypothetical protein